MDAIRELETLEANIATVKQQQQQQHQQQAKSSRESISPQRIVQVFGDMDSETKALNKVNFIFVIFFKPKTLIR